MTISNSRETTVDFAARPLPLSAVRLTGGPLKHAQDLNAAYLLALDPDRMMAFYRLRAGLEPKAPGYGGWDGEGRNLTGHIAGHYLSAASLMYAATGDVRFKDRVDYIVEEMRIVQDAHGDGYLGALEDGQERFAEVASGDIRSGGFDLNGLWAPWYVLHKTYAGLRDAYRLTANDTALRLEVRFAEWAERTLAGLDDAQTQKMLNTEFGGMGEALADLYADTNDDRWLRLSDRFEHRVVVDPLAEGRNVLDGLHGNTQIPKLIASLTRYIQTGAPADGDAARFFWDAVVRHHTYATGGHGKDEYFGPPDALSDRIDGRTCEACNIYNMLKMTRTLFALAPDIDKAEFHERALFNHVLASIDPDDGRVCYMVPVGRGAEHEYQSPFEDFTCCVGTGMESHALHGDGIYYVAQEEMWVNLFVPSRAVWAEMGATVEMETTFPEGESADLSLTLESPREFTLRIRRPLWCTKGFSVSINGIDVDSLSPAGSYIELSRTWRTGDRVRIAMPKTLRLESTPDNLNRAAILWGPLVLGGDLGPENQDGVVDVPVIVTSERSPAEWLTVDATKPGAFHLKNGIGKTPLGDNAQPLNLSPFYRLHRRTYSLYWDLYTPEEWASKAATVATETEARRALDAATVAYVQPGEMQPERDYQMQGEETWPDRMIGRPGRRTKMWFSFDVPVAPESQMTLRVTYCTEERMKRSVRILADGEPIGEHTVERSRPGSAGGHFHEVEYAVPANVVDGKLAVTVRFEATDGNETPAVFGLRMLRSKAGE